MSPYLASNLGEAGKLSQNQYLNVACAFLFPELVEGAALAVDDVRGTYLRLPPAALPAEWSAMSLAGVPRVQYEGEVAKVFAPYPFLEAFLRERRGRFSFAVLDSLLTLIPRDVLDANWIKGHMFERAAVLELSCPASPLWQVLAAQAEFSAKGVEVFPPAKLAKRVFAEPVFDEAARAAVISGDGVFMVQGDSHSPVSGGVVDGAVACRVRDARGNLRNTAVRERCRRR